MPSPVIPKEQLTAYQRWELAAFDEAEEIDAAGQGEAEWAHEPPPPEPVPEPEDATGVALPTAEDLERMHEEARREGYALGLEEGRKTGHQEGHQAGYQEGWAKGEAHARRLTELVASLESEQLRHDEQVADEVLDLALAVAKQMLRVALEVQPAVVIEAIREAMSHLPSLSGHFRVVVHPDDAEEVRAWLAHEHGHLSGKVVEDARVERGGFRFETHQSELNGELPNRWREIVQRLGVDRSWRE